MLVAKESSECLLIERLSTRNYLYWGVLEVDQMEKVLVVADFDWSYVLLVVFSVYSFHKA
jgi:hypothetical protein